MRRLTLAAAFLLSACATRPAVPPVQQPVIAAPQPQQPQHTGLLGMTAGELVQRFGQPALQVREGPGLKLQFRASSCVLDAYLYPPLQGPGEARVTHVDARLPNGADTPQPGCIAALSRS
jgi:hypothetical protein